MSATKNWAKNKKTVTELAEQLSIRIRKLEVDPSSELIDRITKKRTLFATKKRENPHNRIKVYREYLDQRAKNLELKCEELEKHRTQESENSILSTED